MEDILLQYPQVMAIIAYFLMFRGAMGLIDSFIIRPFLTAYHNYVEATPDKKDNEKYQRFLQSKAYLIIRFLFDFATSIKLPSHNKDK